ncbi:hypothetical protein [Altericista sp. CCNU0014]|uniref:hypothetical protein n=1 Tax=Altericista sp. CCNU0014 TaxID=3082949 RepID=UPI00384B299B
MAHALQIGESQVSAAHRHSMMHSLAHRLEAARTARNAQLIELLEREKRQLAGEAGNRGFLESIEAWLKSIAEGLNQAFFGGTTLQVSEFTSGSDRWWYAFDPQTGEQVYADSEIELRLWIKENYRGK